MENDMNIEPRYSPPPHCSHRKENHRFKLNNRSIYRLASRPNPSTNFPGPVSTSAAREDVDNPNDDGKEDNDEDGAPPRSRKKLIEPLVLVLPPREWEWEWPVGGESLALRIRKASPSSWEGGGDDGAVGVDALLSLATSSSLCPSSVSLALSSVLIIRTQTIHQPRLVLHVRSTSRGRARVSR